MWDDNSSLSPYPSIVIPLGMQELGKQRKTTHSLYFITLPYYLFLMDVTFSIKLHIRLTPAPTPLPDSPPPARPRGKDFCHIQSGTRDMGYIKILLCNANIMFGLCIEVIRSLYYIFYQQNTDENMLGIQNKSVKMTS